MTDDLLPITWCAGCDVACGKDEFLIIVPSHWRGDIDIGRIEGYCEQCYCAMGAGGRTNWERAMAPIEWPEERNSRGDSARMMMGGNFREGAYTTIVSNPPFPDDTTITYFDRPRIKLCIFNKYGRCVIAPTGPRPPSWWKPGR